MKCLEKDRGRRYETASGLAEDIERYLADQPVHACPPSRWYRVRKVIRRNRAVAVTAALATVLLLVGTFVSAVLAVRATRAEGLAAEWLEAEKIERGRAVEAERERKRQLVGAKLVQARTGRLSGQVGQRFEGLKVLTEAAVLARELGADELTFHALRDEMAACLALTDVRTLHEWPGCPPGSPTRIGFDADLGRCARSDQYGNIEIRQVEDDRLLARLPGQAPGGGQSGAALLVFSPDGRFLAVSTRHGTSTRGEILLVWDWQAERVVHQPPLALAPGFAVAFSPDGRCLALGLSDKSVAVYETVDWSETARLPIGRRATPPPPRRLPDQDHPDPVQPGRHAVRLPGVPRHDLPGQAGSGVLHPSPVRLHRDRRDVRPHRSLLVGRRVERQKRTPTALAGGARTHR
ncbi:MAG TPA: hypothetical protein VKE74_07525 [Gemmataceae bacterium]|nr:hypothetical protein [Gemmataceae bacterium]